jgi:3-oxoacyl-[acyl-carrier protein] reductase
VMAMRNVIVTGASRGIGLGIASRLAESGFQVIAIARKESPELNEAMAKINAETKGALHFHAADLADISGMAALVKTLRGKFGAIYGLVNNAGIGTSGILSNMQDSAIDRLIALNVTSPITLTKYVARAMMTGKGGRIVSISSIVATTGYSGLSVYSATKAALPGFSRALARELGPLGITVNTVAPGFINTAMTEELNPGQRDQIARRSALKRMADVDDVASAVDFLLSDNARNITGTVMTVDAGNTV